MRIYHLQNDGYFVETSMHMHSIAGKCTQSHNCSWGHQIVFADDLSLFRAHDFQTCILIKLKELQRLRSEDTPRRPKITHPIDQVILDP